MKEELIRLINECPEILFSKNHPYGESTGSNILSTVELVSSMSPGPEQRIEAVLKEAYITLNSLPFWKESRRDLKPTLLVPKEQYLIAEDIIRNSTDRLYKYMETEACDILGTTWYLTWVLAQPRQFAKTLKNEPVQLMNLSGQKIDPTFTNEFPWHYIISIEGIERVLH